MADYTTAQVIPPLQPANILTYPRLHSIHCLHLHRTSQPLPYPISLSAFFHLPSVWLSTSPRMLLSFKPCFTHSLSQLQLAKSVSGRKRTCRFLRRKSPRRLRNRCSVLQCWRLRLINISYINYLHAIRVCRLHTSCQSVSFIPTIPKTYRVKDR